LLNATISGNHASNYGGGAFVMSATVVNSTITGNDGAFQGGGIYGHTIDITNSIAIGNTSQSNPNSLQAFNPQPARRQHHRQQ
jgi:predicted outer membrane repeat protein